MTKKEQEGFKEYAQRWRDLAIQVKPPIIEREMVTMFIDTLLVFPLTKTNTSSYSTRIQVGAMATPPVPYIPQCQSRADVGATNSTRPVQQGARRPPRALTPIPITYTELLPQLLEQKLMEVIPLKPLEPPSREALTIMPSAITMGANRQSNPLPTHRNVAINAISRDNSKWVEKTNRRKGKGSTTKHVNKDDVAYHPLDDYQPLLHEFPDENIMVVEEARSESNLARWKLWFDKASNLLGNGIGAILASPEG
ncbi:hypothetical protein CR513_25351, partial [Mucuna pruriens]